MALQPETFAERYLSAIGATAIAAGPNFRFGAKRRGDRELLGALGFEILDVVADPGRVVVGDPRRAAGGRLSARRQRCSGGRSSSTASSSPATSAGARSATRPRISRSSRASRAPRTGSTPARRSGTAPRSRSGRIRITAASSGGSSRSCSTSTAISTARRLVVEVWERLRDEGGVRVGGGAHRPDRPGRRGDPGCNAARPAAERRELRPRGRATPAARSSPPRAPRDSRRRSARPSAKASTWANACRK